MELVSCLLLLSKASADELNRFTRLLGQYRCWRYPIRTTLITMPNAGAMGCKVNFCCRYSQRRCNSGSLTVWIL